MTPRLVLASQSPRRRELLAQLGVALEVRPADADESVLPDEPPRDYVLRVAREKARAVAGEVVLAADTAVVLGAEVLGKPRDAEDARRMLRALSGTAHEVLTAVCVRRAQAGGALELDVVVATRVRFARLAARGDRLVRRDGRAARQGGRVRDPGRGRRVRARGRGERLERGRPAARGDRRAPLARRVPPALERP